MGGLARGGRHAPGTECQRNVGSLLSPIIFCTACVFFKALLYARVSKDQRDVLFQSPPETAYGRLLQDRGLVPFYPEVA